MMSPMSPLQNANTRFGIHSNVHAFDAVNDPVIDTGDRIGHGYAGEVFVDAKNKGYALKFCCHASEDHMRNEVDLFNQFYGPDSAALIQTGRVSVIRMKL